MKRIFIVAFSAMIAFTNAFAQVDTTKVEALDEVSVVSFYRNDINVGSLVTMQDIVSSNYGQEPSHFFAKFPGIISMNDNGTQFGYGYYRIRGLDQTRINVTLDGMPWNEAEDFGAYFANSPDIMSSMQSVKVERGTGSLNNGVAASAGSINLESVDIFKDNESYAYVGGGSYNTYKVSAVYNSGVHNGFAAHIKATQLDTKGYRDFGRTNAQALTVKLGYKFNDRHSIDFLSLNGQHRNGQGWLGNTAAELEANPQANGCTQNETDYWLQSVNKLQYKGYVANNVVLTASTYLQYQTGDYRFDLDNYMVRMADPTWGTTGVIYDYGLCHYLYGGNVVTKAYLGDFTVTGGVNAYRYQRRHYMDNTLSGLVNVDPSEYYDNTGYKNDVDVFATGTYKKNGFTVSTNLQYRYVDFTYKDALDPTLAFNEGTVWNFINGGVNLEYEFNKSHKIYTRLGVTQREPTRSDMFGGNEFYIGAITTKQAELVHDVELGYAVTTNNVVANVNAYYMKFNNERVLSGTYGMNGLPEHETVNKSYRTGLEGTIDWNVWDALHYSLNASYSFNKIYSDVYSGWKNHILTPSTTVDTDVYYAKSNYKAGANVNYHSKMYVDQANDYAIPYMFTLNLYGSYRVDTVEFGLRLNNLTNRVNYNTGAIGASELLYMVNAGFNAFADVKIYF